MQTESLKILVTGAASGIGRCLALELAREGAQVVAGDIDADGLHRLEADGRLLSGALSTLSLDVTNEASVKQGVETAAARLGSINGLVNSAGILRDGLLAVREPEGWVRKLPTAQWKAVLDVNLTGPYLMTREIAAYMLEHEVRPGLIVNISSITGAGNPGQSNYAAAKAGLDADTRTWALELAPYGIRVAGIAPGLTDTPMVSLLSDDTYSAILDNIPLGRMAQPDEIWLALRFTIECDYFTGRTIAVDGGANF
ncbi:MAG: SDR family oxidoreductase [Candidatus Tectomicrobia bacterium]|nr:SDR family oxidoreductase [Candidatus Tectomicrobia bacterium]